MSKTISKVLCGIMLMGITFGVTITSHAATTYDVSRNSSFKSYMDYRKITSTGSKQYNLQQVATTDENGLRVIDGRYLVAVGTGWNVSVGDPIDFELSTGEVLSCIVGDIKQDVHTDATNKFDGHNSVIEFIVDMDVLDKWIADRGTISVLDGFDGYTTKVTVYEENEKPEDLFYVIDKSSLKIGEGFTYVVYYSDGEAVNSTAVDEQTFNALSIGDIW